MTEKIFENKIKSAVCEMVHRDIESFPSNQELTNMYSLSDDFYDKMEKIIGQVEKNIKKKKRIRAIAVCAACFFLAFLCWKPDIFVKANEVIWQWFQDHIRFEFKYNENVSYQYQMQYLPSGYEIVMDEFDGNIGYIICENAEENLIELVYSLGENDAEYDNKEKEFAEIYEDDKILYYLESHIGEDNILIWEDNETGVDFSLFSVLSYDEMKKIEDGIYRKD